VTYRLDELGWLQFEMLIQAVLENRGQSIGNCTLTLFVLLTLIVPRSVSGMRRGVKDSSAGTEARD